MNNNLVLFMIAKSYSNRLASKNLIEYMGTPLYLYVLKKMITLNIPIYFDSNSAMMCDAARALSPLIATHIRDSHLLDTSVPSVPIFQSMYSYFQLEKKSASVLNIQANSPNIKLKTLHKAACIMTHSNTSELLSIYSHDRSNNGSLWGFSSHRLLNYGDPYTHMPDSFVIDDSVDIHTQEDFDLSIKQSHEQRI